MELLGDLIFLEVKLILLEKRLALFSPHTQLLISVMENIELFLKYQILLEIKQQVLEIFMYEKVNLLILQILFFIMMLKI